jgi:hypothetical protein
MVHPFLTPADRAGFCSIDPKAGIRTCCADIARARIRRGSKLLQCPLAWNRSPGHHPVSLIGFTAAIQAGADQANDFAGIGARSAFAP